jgi:hypothetical protein
MSFCALALSFQKSGRSESAFSSSRRWTATSQSKTPPQQVERRLDLFGVLGDFGAHLMLSRIVSRTQLADI